jgi:hypothetical protein
LLLKQRVRHASESTTGAVSAQFTFQPLSMIGDPR